MLGVVTKLVDLYINYFSYIYTYVYTYITIDNKMKGDLDLVISYKNPE